MPRENQSYGELIRRARIQNDWRQSDLAKRLDVSQSLIAQWETGRQTPPEERRNKLERLLGISRDSRTRELEDIDGPSGFGVWVNRKRVGIGLSVPGLATKAGVTPKTIYDIESGLISSPHERTVVRIEKALNEDAPAETKEVMQEESKIEGMGTWTEFEIQSESDYPECAGIYILFARNKHALYVGEGGSIKGRLSDHIDKSWFSRVEISAYVEVKDLTLRKGIERLLIKCLGPVFNKQHAD